jgi:hypothetical protein
MLVRPMVFVVLGSVLGPMMGIGLFILMNN